MRLERLETLLWERIDGAITADDERELEAFLAEDEEAKELEHELTALAKRLASVREAVPPPVLRQRIDQALAAARGPMAGKRAVTVAVAQRAPIRWAPQVLALAASLLVGVGVGHLLHIGGGQPVDESKAAGAIYVSAVHEAPMGWETVLGEGAGTLKIRRTGTKLAVELRLTEAHEAELLFDAEGGDLRILGVSREAGGPGEVLANEERVVVRTAGPSSTGVELACSDHAASVRVIARLDGENVAERWMGPTGGKDGP